MPRIEKLINKYKDEKNEVNNVVKKMASNSGTKDFKKRDWENIIPNMTCDTNLVKAFRIEAEEKQWSYTTLMNNILKYKYTTIEPELPLIPTENYPSNDNNVNIIKHINLNDFNEEERKNLLLRFNKLNIHWDYRNSFKVDYKSKEFNLLVWEQDLNIMNEEINKMKIKEGN